MAEIIQLNLNKSDSLAPIQNGLQTLGLSAKSFYDNQPMFQASAIYDKEFSIINLPAEFYNKGKISLREALTHELIFACLQIKSLAIQDVLPIVQKKVKTDWEVDETHPLTPVLMNPNPDNTFGDLLAFISVCEDIFGVVYLEKIRNRTRGIVGIQPLDPRTVFERPKPASAVFPNYWNGAATYRLQDIDEYRIEEGGIARILKPEDMIVIRTQELRSALAGESAVRAACRAAGVDLNIDLYISAYLKNGGPSGILKFKNKSLTDEEAQDYQERWTRRYNSKNASNQNAQVTVFDEDADYQAIGSHLGDLGSEASKMHSQAAICSALGVPGNLVQAFYAIRFSNQRAGQTSAQLQLWENTLSPKLTRWRNWLDKALLSEFNGRNAGITARVFWDISSVKALQDDLDKTAARYDRAYKSLAVSKNEYRTKMGLKPVPGGDFIQDDAAAYQQQQDQAQQSHDLAMAQANNPQPDQQPTDPQKKSLKMKRQPTAQEREQAAKVEKAQNESRDALLAILLLLKTGLIQQGLDKLKVLGEHFAQLDLTLTDAGQSYLMKALFDAFYLGLETIAVDIPRSSVDNEKLKSLTAILAQSLTAGVAARMISGYAFQALRRVPAAEILAKIESDSATESTAFYEQIASGAAFQAVADGRSTEADNGSRPYKRVMYSAILDKNTCDFCLEADGRESEDGTELAPVPNPLCEGKWRCRCCWIYIFAEV